MQTGQLILQSGEIFEGELFSSQKNPIFGEVVFNTGMAGYVESLTDPSYAGQILVFTYPLIGNYGVSKANTWESKKIHVKGVVMSELAPFDAHYAATISLKDWLASQNIPVLAGVDTRAITKRLRMQGVVPGAMSLAGKKPQQFEKFDTVDWVKQVSVKEPIEYGKGKKKIIAVDCGMKENILRSLLKFPVHIKRVPYDYDYTKEEFDGLFISNGPGDPKRCEQTIAILKKALMLKKPIFGICLGMQLLGLAIGAKTYKLTFGHRSQNQPCLELTTQRCVLTSQNHGYAVEEKTLPKEWKISFKNLNDGTVAGIEHKNLPYFSVQFHPEACPGPEDAHALFEKFYKSL